MIAGHYDACLVRTPPASAQPMVSARPHRNGPACALVPTQLKTLWSGRARRATTCEMLKDVVKVRARSPGSLVGGMSAYFGVVGRVGPVPLLWGEC